MQGTGGCSTLDRVIQLETIGHSFSLGKEKGCGGDEASIAYFPAAEVAETVLEEAEPGDPWRVEGRHIGCGSAGGQGFVFLLEEAAQGGQGLIKENGK